MKVVSSFLLICIFLTSCQNDAKQIPKDEVSVEREVPKVTTTKSLPYRLEYDEGTQRMTLIERQGNSDKLSQREVVELLNEKHRKIKLDLLKSSNDTVFLKIKNATNLTQEMGSAGAQAYLAEVTFSITKVKGIQVVDLLFEEGDHAMPGSYKREDFSEFKVVEQK
jgi:hypothetical protein